MYNLNNINFTYVSINACVNDTSIIHMYTRMELCEDIQLQVIVHLLHVQMYLWYLKLLKKGKFFGFFLHYAKGHIIMPFRLNCFAHNFGMKADTVQVHCFHYSHFPKFYTQTSNTLT